MFRWFVLVILVGAVGTSGYFRRRAWIEGGTIARREEGALLVALRAGVTLPFLPAIVAYVAPPPTMSWSAVDLPLWARWAGVAVGLATIPSVAWVLGALGRNVSETVLTKADHALVTAGPYRWVRHPLYTTGLALLGAITLMAANWFFGLFAIVAGVLIRYVVIPPEEHALVAKFGDDYRRYMTQSSRLLPGLF